MPLLFAFQLPSGSSPEVLPRRSAYISVAAFSMVQVLCGTMAIEVKISFWTKLPVVKSNNPVKCPDHYLKVYSISHSTILLSRSMSWLGREKCTLSCKNQIPVASQMYIELSESHISNPILRILAALPCSVTCTFRGVSIPTSHQYQDHNPPQFRWGNTNAGACAAVPQTQTSVKGKGGARANILTNPAGLSRCKLSSLQQEDRPKASKDQLPPMEVWHVHLAIPV